MRRRRKPGRLDALLRRLGLRRGPKPPERSSEEQPPDGGVREPRRPRPSASGGAATLELPETETDDTT